MGMRGQLTSDTTARRLGRRAFVSAAAATLAGVWPAWRTRRAAASAPGDFLSEIDVRTAAPFAGDKRGLVTLAPGGRGGRDEAVVGFRLQRTAQVDLTVAAHRGAGEHDTSVQKVFTEAQVFGPGRHTISWLPEQATPNGTYVLRLGATDLNGRRVDYREVAPGYLDIVSAGRRRNLAPVARVIGIDAAFDRLGYAPGERATLVVAADAVSLTVQFLRCGLEQEPTYANNEMKGVPVGEPLELDWQANADGPEPIVIQLGLWPSGVYCARITSADGRIGFAPFVLRPAEPKRRIAVVVPTYTWQAYNFYDVDADGYGDSWYVSPATTRIDLTRPHLNRGVPYRYRSYDLAFLRWLAATGKEVDFYADDDLKLFASGDDLRTAYDLVAFPGHTEYVTAHVYDVVERYRDLGGNLLFLSANNFFRRVNREGNRLRLVGLWRDRGRPEAGLCGVQYRASDRGERQAPFVVGDVSATPWAFEGTGLDSGSLFGLYGIEIDSRARSSPPGTRVLARLPNLFGPGRSAEMTYYEAPSGARVFSAGVLNFGGQIALWPEALKLLENVWARLAPV